MLLLAFLLTGPHDADQVIVWLLPVPVLVLMDSLPWREPQGHPGRQFENKASAILALIAILAALNVLALGHFVSVLLDPSTHQEVWVLLLDLLALRMLGGTTFCCAVIAPAHELMHRRSRWVRRLSRAMLMLVFADVFYLSHGAGHHRHLGSKRDPSTARSGETYPLFLKRSLKAQWYLAKEYFPIAFRRGVITQLVLLLSFTLAFGIPAAMVWVYLSGVAICLLEAVNYFQHYGLIEGTGFEKHTAWRCDRGVSFFLFLGLTRHSDHHRRPKATCTELRHLGEGPELPLGYLGTAIWVKNHSRSYGRMADRALGLHGAPATQKV